MEPRATTAAAVPREPAGTARGIARRLPLLLGAITGVLLCAAAIALTALLAPRTPDPRSTARALCDDLTSQDYAAAYTLLAPTVRAQGTQAQFVASQRQLDVLRGRVTRCAYTISGASTASAIVTLSLTRGPEAAATAEVRLIFAGHDWLVSAFDTSLVRVPARLAEFAS